MKTDCLPERSVGEREIGAISNGRVCDSPKVFKKSQKIISHQKQQQNIKSVDVPKRPVNCGSQVNKSVVTDSCGRVSDSPNILELPKQAENGRSQHISQHNPPGSVITPVGGACRAMHKDQLSQQKSQSSLNHIDNGKEKQSTEQGTSSGGPSDSIKICRVQEGSFVVKIKVGDLELNAKLDSLHYKFVMTM